MNKYRAVKTELDGITFDSKKEANRYAELKLLERAGVIRDLELQKTFVLQDGYSFRGKHVLPITYRADFFYFDIEKNDWIVEDTKGVETKVFEIKKKLFEKKFGMQIVEP